MRSAGESALGFFGRARRLGRFLRSAVT